MKILGLDIGNHTAAAIYDTTRNQITYTNIHHANKTQSLEEKLKDTVFWFKELLIRVKPSVVKIEGVKVYSSSAKSLAAAFSGDTIWLAYLAGALFNEATRNGCEAFIITPQQWKGSMPKDVVDNRINLALGCKFPEHVSDAVGICLSHVGRL